MNHMSALEWMEEEEDDNGDKRRDTPTEPKIPEAYRLKLMNDFHVSISRKVVITYVAEDIPNTYDASFFQPNGHTIHDEPHPKIA